MMPHYTAVKRGKVKLCIATHVNFKHTQAKKKRETGMNEKGYVWYQPTYTQLLKTCKTEVGIVWEEHSYSKIE